MDNTLRQKRYDIRRHRCGSAFESATIIPNASEHILDPEQRGTCAFLRIANADAFSEETASCARSVVYCVEWSFCVREDGSTASATTASEFRSPSALLR